MSSLFAFSPQASPFAASLWKKPLTLQHFCGSPECVCGRTAPPGSRGPRVSSVLEPVLHCPCSVSKWQDLLSSPPPFPDSFSSQHQLFAAQLCVALEVLYVSCLIHSTLILLGMREEEHKGSQHAVVLAPGWCTCLWSSDEPSQQLCLCLTLSGLTSRGLAQSCIKGTFSLLLPWFGVIFCTQKTPVEVPCPLLHGGGCRLLLSEPTEVIFFQPIPIPTIPNLLL